MSSPTFGRILTALITPFGGDGNVDLDVAQRLARRLVDEGNEGLVVCGTTGESPALSDDEKLSMFSAVIEAVNVPVIAGTVGNNTAHSVELSLRAKALGVHGILSLCPYYNRPSQAGIEQHLRAIAQAVDLPQVIYDIPVRTGRKVSSEVLLRLAHEEKNVIGLKDAAANPAETARVIKHRQISRCTAAMTVSPFRFCLWAPWERSVLRPTGRLLTMSTCSQRWREATLRRR